MGGSIFLEKVFVGRSCSKTILMINTIIKLKCKINGNERALVNINNLVKILITSFYRKLIFIVLKKYAFSLKVPRKDLRANRFHKKL